MVQIDCLVVKYYYQCFCDFWKFGHSRVHGTFTSRFETFPSSSTQQLSVLATSNTLCNYNEEIQHL